MNSAEEIRDRLIRSLDDSREEMRQVLGKVANTSDIIYPTWTIKQVLAHIAGWDEAVYASLEAFRKGEAPTTPADRGIDEYNARSVARRQELALEQVRQEWESARQLVKQVLRAIPSEKFFMELVAPWGETGTIEQLVMVFVEHEVEHAREIALLLQPDK